MAYIADTISRRIIIIITNNPNDPIPLGIITADARSEERRMRDRVLNITFLPGIPRPA